MFKKAIYPGTFDPITLGHIDILKRSALIFERVIVGIAIDSGKNTMFSPKERQQMAENAVENYGIANVEIKTFKGLLVDFSRQQQARIIIRGLRAVSDFEFEFQMAYMNRKISPEIETILLPATENGHFISSSFVKQISSLGGNVDELVTPYVAKKLMDK